MYASYLTLDDLDFAFEAPADDDIGEPIEGGYQFIDFDAFPADDVASFDASDMAFTDPLPAPHHALHSGPSDDDLLEVWFRLEDARQEPVEGVCVTAPVIALVQTLAPVVAAPEAIVALEPTVEEPQEVPAEVVALSAYALAKAALAAKPPRRRRTTKGDDRQLALFC